VVAEIEDNLDAAELERDRTMTLKQTLRSEQAASHCMETRFKTEFSRAEVVPRVQEYQNTPQLRSTCY